MGHRVQIDSDVFIGCFRPLKKQHPGKIKKPREYRSLVTKLIWPMAKLQTFWDPGPSKVIYFLHYLHFDLVLYISGMFCLKKCK